MLNVSIELTGTGWLKTDIRDNGNKIEITASYLSDAPKDLITAVNNLLKGSKMESIFWLEEPGQYSWLFEKKDENVIIKIYDFNGWPYDNWLKVIDKGNLVLSSQTSLIDFANNIYVQYAKLASEFGTKDYKKKWVNYEFPLEEKIELQKLLKKD
jgi:hypothetical protein